MSIDWDDPRWHEDDDDMLEGHAGDPDADPDAVDPDHTPDPDYREGDEE